MKCKRVLAVLMTAAMTLSLAACGSNSGSDSKKTEKEDKTYTVGVCQLVQHDALDAATQGFQDALEEKLGDKVKIEVENASGDSATCATITTQFVNDNVDLIMANATPALQAAMAATADIPIVATPVTDFATALDISDWTGKTGINVTGTADLAPLDEQAAMVKELVPDAKTVGILYCSAEPNSKYQAETVTDELEKLGFEVKDYTVADTNEISSVTKKACDEVDCIYIPTDNTIASATAAVNEIATPANIPIIAGEEGICKGCGVATLSISYYSIFFYKRETAYDILVNGKDPADMDIEFATDLTKKYVEDRATALNITVPEDYEAIDMSAE